MARILRLPGRPPAHGAEGRGITFLFCFHFPHVCWLGCCADTRALFCAIYAQQHLPSQSVAHNSVSNFKNMFVWNELGGCVVEKCQ